MVASISPAAAEADSWTSQEGNFNVCYQERYGIIGRDGKTILKPTYPSISDFHEGLATFQQGDKAGVLNKSGRVQVKATFEEIGPFANGKALARAYSPRKPHPKTGDWECAGLWGMIDTHGNWLVKPTYDYVNALNKEYNLVTKGGKRGFVDRNLKVLVAPTFDELYDISEGMAAFGEKGKLGYIDKQGKVIVQAKYKATAPFKEGLARVQNADGWGYIDQSGKTVISHQYKDASSFSEGAALVRTFDDADGQFFIKHDGSKLVKNKYAYARSFKNGKARVELFDRTQLYKGYIDKSGIFTANDKDDEYAQSNQAEVSEGLCIVKSEEQSKDIEVMPTKSYTIKDTFGRERFRLSKIYSIREFHDGVAIFSASVLSWKKPIKPHSDRAKEPSKSLANPYAAPQWKRHILSQPANWGYKDSSGNVVIPPKFRQASTFSEGIAEVEEGLLAGYIDKTGRYAIKPCFPIGASTFDNGIAYGTKCSKEFSAKPFQSGSGCVQNTCYFRLGLINRSGKFITEPRYEQFRPISEGRLAFRLDGKWGFMDSSGKVVIEPKYAAVQPFSEGLAAVTEEAWDGGLSPIIPSAWGFVDRDGKLVIPHQYRSAGSFHDGLALVSENCHNISGKPEGFIDKAGKLQISSDQYLSSGFEGGVAVRCQNKKRWLIDTSAKPLTDDLYDQLGVEEDKAYRLVSEGLIPVRKGSFWGFIDTAGNCVIPPQFNEVGHFHDGLAVVKFKHGHLAYIDQLGQIQLDENYDVATRFHDGAAIIANDQGTYVIDKSGKHLFDATGIKSYSEGLFLWQDKSKEPINYFYNYQYD